MRCPTCGTENSDSAQTCVSCGSFLTSQKPMYGTSSTGSVPNPSSIDRVQPGLEGEGVTSRKAIASFVMGIFSLLICLLAIPSIIAAALALRDINRVPGRKGTVYAILGIVLSVVACAGWLMVGMLAAIAVPNFLEAKTRAQVSRTRSDMRTFATAIEAYYIDYLAYPAWNEKANFGANLPSALTTPVAYIYFGTPHQDPFAQQEATFGYYSVNNPDGEDGWILFSPGPDGDYDLKPQDFYVPGQEQRLAPFTYDPTNGTVSDGDLIRVKQ